MFRLAPDMWCHLHSMGVSGVGLDWCVTTVQVAQIFCGMAALFLTVALMLLGGDDR